MSLSVANSPFILLFFSYISVDLNHVEIMATKSTKSTDDDEANEIVYQDASSKTPDAQKPILKGLRTGQRSLKANPRPQCPAFAKSGIKRSPIGDMPHGKMSDASDTDTSCSYIASPGASSMVLRARKNTPEGRITRSTRSNSELHGPIAGITKKGQANQRPMNDSVIQLDDENEVNAAPGEHVQHAHLVQQVMTDTNIYGYTVEGGDSASLTITQSLAESLKQQASPVYSELEGQRESTHIYNSESDSVGASSAARVGHESSTGHISDNMTQVTPLNHPTIPTCAHRATSTAMGNDSKQAEATLSVTLNTLDACHVSPGVPVGTQKTMYNNDHPAEVTVKAGYSEQLGHSSASPMVKHDRADNTTGCINQGYIEQASAAANAQVCQHARIYTPDKQAVCKSPPVGSNVNDLLQQAILAANITYADLSTPSLSYIHGHTAAAEREPPIHPGSAVCRPCTDGTADRDVYTLIYTCQSKLWPIYNFTSK